MTEYGIESIHLFATDREGILCPHYFLPNGQSTAGPQEPDLWTTYWEYKGEGYRVELGYYHHNKRYPLGFEDVREIVKGEVK